MALTGTEGALESLLEALNEHPEASYSYGAYNIGSETYCDQEFRADALRLMNYISTMSLIRTKDFPALMSTLYIVDWYLWLTMLDQGKTGVYCGRVIFDTPIRDGITQNGKVPFSEAYEIVKKKHAQEL